MDVRDVDGTFLNLEIWLAESMTILMNETNSTDVNCIVSLIQMHTTFHTWTTEDVITTKLFVSGAGLLLHMIPIKESLFGPP